MILTNLCLQCEFPVISASMSGDQICPSCDLGKCRFCYQDIFAFKKEIDGGRSLKRLREHVKKCKEAYKKEKQNCKKCENDNKTIKSGWS